MGNKLKQSSFFTKNAMSQIGTAATCPNCERIFPPSTTYENFDQHVTQCLDTFRPSDQERLRMQRRKKSKDSSGSKSSQDNQDNHDYITIQIYIKKSETPLVPQNVDSKQKQAQNQKQKVELVGKTPNSIAYHLPRKSYWMKSNLTYSESLLCSLTLNEIECQGTAYKILWFHHKLANMRVTWKSGAQHIMFRSEHIVRDSLRLRNFNMYKQLKIAVANDVVRDAGGLLREWASMLLKDLIINYRLFVRNKSGLYILNPQLTSKQALNSPAKYNPPQKGKQVQFALQQNFVQSQFSKQFQKLKELYWSKMQEQYPGQEDYYLDQDELGYLEQMQNQINSTKDETFTYADLYELFAAILSKILIEKVTVDVGFDWIMLGDLLAGGKKCRDHDLQRLYTYDSEIYSSLVYMLELQNQLKSSSPNQTIYKQKLQQLRSLCLTFTIPSTQNTTEHVLIPKGQSIAVDSLKNLQLYIQKFQNYYINELHRNQLSIIKGKFNSIIKPEHFRNLFSCQQFQIMINGVNGDDINVQDWQDGTQYKQPYHKNHKVIKFFWAAVNKMSSQNKMRLLKFVTGAERLPVYGFKNLETNRGETSHFVIESIEYDKKFSAFPKAHTCFNRLMLPLYPNQNALTVGLQSVLEAEFDGIWGMQ